MSEELNQMKEALNIIYFQDDYNHAVVQVAYKRLYDYFYQDPNTIVLSRKELEVMKEKADGIRSDYEVKCGEKCDCATINGALHYGRAQGIEIIIDEILSKGQKDE